MTTSEPLPRYRFRADPPSLREVALKGMSDVASIIPAAILEERCIQLPSPPFGPKAPLVVADPELVRAVLSDPGERFGRDPLMRRMMRRSWGDGLAGAEGQSWKEQRRAAAPAFRPNSVAALTGAFALAAQDVTREWPRNSDIDLTEEAGRIIARIVFRVLVAAEDVVDPDVVARIMPAYVQRISRFGLTDLMALPEAWHDRIHGIPGDPAVRFVNGTAARVAAGRPKDGATADLIDLLAPHGPVEDNIRGLFPAALDTTVKAVSWALFVLSRRPEWQHRVAAEAQACEGSYAAEKLSLTKRVVQETIRLFPPAPLLVRTALVDTELDGRELQAGQTVAAALYAMHRHRSAWENPHEFDPDRFLPERGRHPAFLPFGVGPRVCVAAQFALTEITVVVAQIASDLVLAPVGPQPELSLQVTTHATTPMLVRASDRQRD